MKSKEFLIDWNNKMDKLKVQNIKDFAAKVKQDCQPFLKQIGPDIENYSMYRGIEVEREWTIDLLKKAFELRTSRLADRQPRGTRLDIHNNINEALKKIFGKPWRNALFVSGNRKDAAWYGNGNTFRVYPVGDFEFLWSPKIVDLLPTWDKIKDKHKSKEEALNELMDLVSSSYQTTNLKEAIASGNEIHIWVNSYYTLHDSIPAAQRRRFTEFLKGSQ